MHDHDVARISSSQGYSTVAIATRDVVLQDNSEVFSSASAEIVGDEIALGLSGSTIRQIRLLEHFRRVLGRW